MRIDAKNIAFQTVDLTADTVFKDCNLTLTRLTTNGFAYSFEDCLVQGLYVDGVKQDAFVYREYAPDPVALDILDRVGKWTGQDGIDAWRHWVAVIHADPTITREAAKSEWIVWADSVHNLLHFDSAVDSFLRNLELAGWGELVALILSKTPETWAGLPTVVIREVS